MPDSLSNVPRLQAAEIPSADGATPAGRPSLVAFFETEESALLGFAIGLVGRRSVAEELVQEAFLRLHQLWEQVENPRAWLYRALRNLALNHLRDHAREVMVEAPEGPGNESAPDEALDRLEAVGTVRMLLAELAPDDQALIRLKYHDDLKYEQISQQTGLSVSNVGYKLHHLLKGLADGLRRAGIEGSRGITP
jgi:RNA polymerase sigma-70 factor (ECF subfamily)